jgi:hypothetical protein
MDIPRVLRKQLAYYAQEGFDAVDIKHAAGSHVKVVFAQFTEPQILTRNMKEPRALKNNIARFRRLAKEQEQ